MSRPATWLSCPLPVFSLLLLTGLPPAFTHAAQATPTQRFEPAIVGVLRFDTLVYQAARHHQIDYALVMAVIHTESRFNPRATSDKGAAGLMQLMPATARKYGARDRYNPRQNIEAGIRYLKTLLRRYPGKLKFALAAYNAGEAAVDRYQGIPPYPETRDYVKKVLRFRTLYQDWP